jgi:ATP-dependent DNA ligase
MIDNNPAQGQPERSVLRHIEAVGEELFALACKRDLEGIVAKHKFGPHLQASAQWFKVRNRKYSQ